MNKSLKNQFWIYISLLISIIIDIYVLPEAIISWKPLTTLLVLIYWNMAIPDKVGVFEALLFGIFLDLLTGSILGLHAILFVLITYICQRFFYQFRVSPLWQQSFMLFFLFFIFRLAFAFDYNNEVSGFNLSDRGYVSTSLFFALLSSASWTPLFYILREFRRRKIKI